MWKEEDLVSFGRPMFQMTFCWLNGGIWDCLILIRLVFWYKLIMFKWPHSAESYSRLFHVIETSWSEGTSFRRGVLPSVELREGWVQSEQKRVHEWHFCPEPRMDEGLGTVWWTHTHTSAALVSPWWVVSASLLWVWIMFSVQLSGH